MARRILSVCFVASAAVLSSGRLRADSRICGEGILPKDGRVDIVDAISGTVRTVDDIALTACVPWSPHPVVLSLFDASGRPLGILRRELRDTETVWINEVPTPARGTGQLALLLAFPKESADDPSTRDVRVALALGGRQLPPDVVVRAGTTVRAFWLAAPSAEGTVAVLSAKFAPAKPVPISVPDRGVSIPAEVLLLRRPTLTIRLEGAEKLPGKEATVELFPCERLKEFTSSAPKLSQCETPRPGKLLPGETVEFTGLLPGTYAYRWRAGSLSATGWIDVPTFADAERVIEVNLYEISGQVRRRGDGVTAHLVFEAPASGDFFEANSEESGRYRLALAERGRFSVRIRTNGFPDFPSIVDVAGDTSKDFELPANRFLVRVLGAEDGLPIPKARVDYEVEGAGWNSRKDPLSAKAFTSDDGSVALPPVPSGFLKVSARQNGYRPGDAAPVRVDDSTPGGEIVVSLAKSETVRIRLVEPDGAPAAGAFVWTAGPRGASPTADDGTTLFEGALPPGTPLFAFDGRGRMAFTRSSGEKEQSIQIPSSGPPVTIRFQNPAGEPVKRLVRVGVDDVVMLDGPFAQQVFWSGSQWSSGADGVARIVGLPAQGMLTVFPGGRPDLAVTRRLPVTEEIVITLPAEQQKMRSPENVAANRL